MKRILTCLLALLLLATLVGCGKNEAGDIPSGMQLASSEDADYLFYVPADWLIDKSALYSAAYYSPGADATSISVAAYGMSALPVSDTSDAEGETTAAEVSAAEAMISGWWKSFEEEFGATFASMEVTATESTALGGMEAVKYSFDATLAGKEYRYIVAATMRGSYIYYVTYTSTPEYYEEHLEALDQVLTHFAFK